jgi:Family of unknown function (DUF6502)
VTLGPVCPTEVHSRSFVEGHPMSDDTQLRLLQAVYACLRPLVRLLIRSGVTYGQFADMAKLAFVLEANREKDERGRTINASRISVKTGISRKEVRRIRALQPQLIAGRIGLRRYEAAVPAQVLHLWYSDSKYLDTHGRPRQLPLHDPSPSFAELVRSVSGDIPLGAIRAELKQAGAIDELENGTVCALKRYYIPSAFDEKAIAGIPRILFPLAATMAYNANPRRTTQGYIQRFAYSHSLSPGSVDDFRRWSRIQATDFIESIDSWLGAREQPSSGDAHAVSRPLVGVGVFYYEGPAAEDSISDDVREIL